MNIKTTHILMPLTEPDMKNLAQWVTSSPIYFFVPDAQSDMFFQNSEEFREAIFILIESILNTF